jgi:phospholipase C
MRVQALAMACVVGAPMLACAATFKHVVIIFQENRTPDNIFCSNPTFEPGVDIATSGKDSQGKTIALTAVPLNSCYDISHTHMAFEQMYDNGAMDGANKEQGDFYGDCAPPLNAQFKFADNSTGTVQPYFDIAAHYGFANRMFQTNQGPSFPAHQFIFGGTSAPTATSPVFADENMIDAAPAGCTAPKGQRVQVIGPKGEEYDLNPVFPCFNRATMADLLDSAQISWKYYLNTNLVGSIWNAPAAIRDLCVAQSHGGVSNCTGPDYVNKVISAQAQVLTDIANCDLPAVSWVIPNAADSDHALVNRGTGPAWVASIVNAIGTQATCPGGDTYWDNTAIFITWDDWGGWYDHVPPYQVVAAGNWGAGYVYGFRVPLLVVSAYTPAGYVNNQNLNFGSILNFIESNFGLGHIGTGDYADAHALSPAAFFSLTAPRSFKSIPARYGADYFLHVQRSAAPLDND